MNSRRLSKPNLPSLPKYSNLLLQQGCAEPVFFSLLDSAINHSINQCELIPSQLLPKAPKSLFTNMGMVRKVLANEPLKDVTMGRVRVEEFEELLCKNCG